MEIEKTKHYGDVTVDKLFTATHQKADTLTAQLRQVITHSTTYPKVQVTDGVSDNLFGNSEFNIAKSEPYTSTENRIYFMNVPAGSTKQDMELKLQKARDEGKNPTICKIISNRPITTDNQDAAITKGILTYDKVAKRQIVRYGSKSEQAGKLILNSSGEVMYKRTFFFENRVEDEKREHEESYISQELNNELNSQMEEENLSIDTVSLF